VRQTPSQKIDFYNEIKEGFATLPFLTKALSSVLKTNFVLELAEPDLS
jgi:hypothetical protein